MFRGGAMTFEEYAAWRLPALVRYAAVLTGDRDLAQDIVQEVLARAHARWRKISGLEVPDLYVRRMITNEFVSWRRRRSEEHTSELQSRPHLVCRLLLEKKKK